MKVKKGCVLLMLTLGLTFIGIDCKKDKPCTTCPPTIQNTVKLSLDYTECQQVWLKLSFTDANQPRSYALFRDDRQLLAGTLTATDTLLVDDSVVAGHDYIYTAQRLNGSNVIDASTALPIHTLDSTSHSINWIVDTLGTQGLIRDVWVFNRNNAWAVGGIYLNDSTGKPNEEYPYNAAHWDGSKWELMRILFYTICGQQSRNAYEASSIFAFSETDIWIALNGSQVARWNGNTQTSTMCLPVSFSINKLWGENPNSVYAVGYDGAYGIILHYNGSSWTKMTSNTSVDLQDIWGNDGSHIWATGTNVADGHCVVLQYNGTSWSTIYDNTTRPLNQIQYFKTVWTNNQNYIYLDGGSGLYKLTMNNSLGSQISTGLTYVVSSIRGIKQNDIFDVTTGGEVAHYNGSSWYSYLNIQALNKSGAWFTSVYPTSNFVLIGGWYLTTYNGAPIVIRGYK